MRVIAKSSLKKFWSVRRTLMHKARFTAGTRRP